MKWRRAQRQEEMYYVLYAKVDLEERRGEREIEITQYAEQNFLR
jgi:hypothetical protein